MDTINMQIYSLNSGVYEGAWDDLFHFELYRDILRYQFRLPIQQYEWSVKLLITAIRVDRGVAQVHIRSLVMSH